jgi:hypothetical protein
LGRYEIGLIKDDRVGEGQLLLRFMCAVDLAEKVPGIDNGDDGVESCLGADILVDEESLGDRRGVGEARRLGYVITFRFLNVIT